MPLKTIIKFQILSFLISGNFIYGQTATIPLGSGTSSSPYQIATLNNLYWISQNTSSWGSGKYFVQTADIDATVTNSWFSDGSGNFYGFPPIGGRGSSLSGTSQISGIFQGTYDGGGYKITNLYIRRPNDMIALFGQISNATIKNLALETPTVIIPSALSDKIYGAGILVGYCQGGSTVLNVALNGGSLSSTTSSSTASLGTIVGWDAGITISNTSTSASVNLTGGYAGAFVGYKAYGNSTYTNCSARGNISSTTNNGARIGGFAGIIDGTNNFSKCSSIGNVSGYQRGGGFVGELYGNSTFTDCYAMGNINLTHTSLGYGGGFYGYNAGGTSISFTNCYSKGLVNASSSGGFGSTANSNFTFTNCFWDTQTSGKNTALSSSTPSTGITGKTTAEMNTTTTFQNATWDLNTIWNMATGTNNGYPFIRNNGSTLPVTWLDFTATKQPTTVELSWSTATEHNTKDFQVQYSTNAQDWSVLGMVTAAGSSFTTKNYAFIHGSPLKNNTYNYYRIKQNDIDGKFSFSKIVSIIYNEMGPEVKVYPNPATSLLNVYLAESQHLRLLNMAGAIVWQTWINAGSYTIPIAHLPKGVYILMTVKGPQRILIQ